MEPFPFSNPLDSWLPYLVAFVVGVVVFIRTYMRGPECPSNASITGKTIIITGGNSGIGKQTAIILAQRGGRIILACRSSELGEEAVQEIKKLSGSTDIHVMNLDLASFSSVRQFAKKFNDKYDCLDILINNAGIMLSPFTKTEDGYESHFQVNYLSHFLLTHLLLDKLKAAPAGRIINVSALAHQAAVLNLDDLNSEVSYNNRDAYGCSKLAQILFTVHLSKELQGSKVTVNALHPGIVKDTNILRFTSLYNSFYLTLATPLMWLLLKTPKDGAQTTVYLAVASEIENVSGKYFSDCQVKEPSNHANDEELAQKLWDISLKLTNIK